MQYKISFQHIDYFLTVAESLSFTDASKALFISQPALSKQISVLEKELGFPLFIRDRRHVVLTPEGASLERDWKALNHAMEAAINKAKYLSQHTSGELSIGASDTFDYHDILPKIVREYSQTYPDVNLDVSSHSFKTLREGLITGKYDLIFTPYFELDGLGNVNWMKLKDIPLSIIVPTSNPLSLQDNVTLRDLKGESFILISPKDSLGGTERTQSLCRRCGVRLKNTRYVPNVTSMKLAVQNGLGVAICNSDFIDKENDMCRIYPLDVVQEDSFLVAVWSKNNHNISLDLFLNILNAHFPTSA